ncbi:hypothetical protein GCM10010400_65620 [Streptomyces aculeolatus]|uniref:flavin reductase n=1 Tax=Streptomyces aculeolatus TaxID=270689 RepID=UPI001CEC4750|nr:flavin reductase [Streptomyces aculeolatus]
MTTTPDLRAAFTEVMAAVPTPVSVVTAIDGDRPHGTTVSAFTSLSLNPPMADELVNGGDHVIVLGTVTRAESSGRTPLTYHARTYGTHTPHNHPVR